MKYFYWEYYMPRGWQGVFCHGEHPDKRWPLRKAETWRRPKVIEVPDDTTLEEVVKQYPQPKDPHT